MQAMLLQEYSQSKEILQSLKISSQKRKCFFTSEDKRHFKKHLHKIHNRQAKCKLCFYKNIHNPKKVYNHSRSVHRGENVFLPLKTKDISRSKSIRSEIDKQNASYASTRIFTIQRKFTITQDQFTEKKMFFFTSEDKRHFKKHIYKVKDRQAKCKLCFYKNIHNPKKVYNHSRSVHRRENVFLPLKTKDISKNTCIRSTIDKQNASYASTRIFTIQRKFTITQDQFTEEKMFFTSENKRHFKKHIYKVKDRQAKCKLCFYKNIHNPKKLGQHAFWNF
ncbi:hypothetical protein EB796_019002 [Bugula neritina]|uniref:Uncharacterized protein n=1 Tax=Bugula neritina TaxID=10212 RepID=A0A7J7JAI1_BUGNE|nr:hypothetical protein EB796_019002 [Bugula neritina]